MAKGNPSSKKRKNDQSGLKGRQICTRSSAILGLTMQETTGLRRSSRRTLSKKPNASASSTRKSQGLEKRAPTPSSVTRKSKKIGKKSEPNSLRRSDGGKIVSSPNSTGLRKSSRNSGTSSDIGQRKDRKEKNLEDLINDIKQHKTRMIGHTNRASLTQQPKKSQTLANQQENKVCDMNHVDDIESSHNCAKDLGETFAQVAQEESIEREVSSSAHSVQEIGHVEEINTSANTDESAVADTSLTPFGGNNDAEKVGAECPLAENSDLPKQAVGETTEKDADSQLKRKRSTVEVALDASGTGSNTDGCIMSVEGTVSSSFGCKSFDHPEMCSTCPKLQSGVTGAAVSMGFQENNDKNVQQDASLDCKSDSLRFAEYWVPVQISNIQLEQYCQTLLSKSLSLCSLSKSDHVGALHDTLISVRKTCDHPYAVDHSLKLRLTENLKSVEYLDADIKASGKLHLLDALLTEIRKRGSKVVVLYQKIGGSGRSLIGDFLDDFVCERFGPTSYERVERNILSTKKQDALNKFNKESGRFVLLLETRACNPNIKLSSVEAFIIFDSSWTPLNDLRALQKIKVESESERTKIFRLYTAFTVEEKALILARQNKTADGRESLNLSTTHALLMWGASYLFDKLDHFHSNSTRGSGLFSKQSVMASVIHEFLSILSSKGGGKDKGKQSLILEARHFQGTYGTDYALLGEEKIKLSDEDKPNIFWTKLLEGKSPTWKYCSVSSQRNRTRPQYSMDSQKDPELAYDGVPRKRKKTVGDCSDQPASHDEEKACRNCHKEMLEPPSLFAMQPSPRSVSGVNDTVHGSVSLGSYALGGNISGIPEDMLVGNDGWRRLHESQKCLQAELKPEMAKLCQVLHLSEEVTSTVENFLEYVINNHRVHKESTTTLQAFQIAMCWTAASLLKQKINHEESLALAKDHLMFCCSIEEVDYIYSMLCCMKSVFLERTRCLKLDCLPKDSEQSKNSTGKNQLDANSSVAMLLRGRNTNIACSTEVQECRTKGGCIHYSLVKKDTAKSIREIQKKCNKEVTKLLEKHEEEKEEVYRNFMKERSQLENKKKVEAVIIRKHISIDNRVDKLQKLYNEYEVEFNGLKGRMEKWLENLGKMHTAGLKKLREKEAHWIERIRNWEQAELLNHFPDEDSNSKHCSRLISSNTSKNAPDAAGACDRRTGEVLSVDTNGMVSEERQEGLLAMDPLQKVRNTGGTTLDVGTQLDVTELVASNNGQDENALPVMPSQRHLNNVATESGHVGLPWLSEPEFLTASDSQEKVVALGSPFSGAQVCDGVTSSVGDISLRVPGTSYPGVNLENVADAVMRSNGEQASVTMESNGANIVVSGSDAMFSQPNEGIATLESGGASPDQAVENSCPSSSTGNVERQNISEAAEPWIPKSSARFEWGGFSHEVEVRESDPQMTQLTPGDASRGHDPPVDAVSNVDINRNAETSTHCLENHVQHAHESVVQPSATVTGDQRANAQDGGSMINVTANTSLPNNYILQSAVQAAPQMPLQFFSDPFQYELEKIGRELEKAEKTHDEEMSQLKAKCERKIAEIVAQVRCEYDGKLRDLDSKFYSKKKELETSKSYIIMNKCLADAFETKWPDLDALAAPATPSDATAGLIQQTSEFRPQSSSTIPPRCSITSMAPPPTPSAVPSSNSPLYPVALARPPQTRPPLIANTAPSPASGTSLHGRFRAPAPHLRPFRPSSLPCGTLTQHSLQNPPTMASPSPPLGQHVQRPPSQTQQNALCSRNMPVSAVELPLDVPNQARVSHRAGSAALALTTLIQLQQQQRQRWRSSGNSMLENRPEVSERSDVVCLSDDE